MTSRLPHHQCKATQLRQVQTKGGLRRTAYGDVGEAKLADAALGTCQREELALKQHNLCNMLSEARARGGLVMGPSVCHCIMYLALWQKVGQADPEVSAASPKLKNSLSTTV